MSQIITAAIAALASIATSHWLTFHLAKDQWRCTASHREGPEHSQKDVCDQYSRKEK